MLPSISRRAKKPSENPVKRQLLAELWEHTPACSQIPQQAPADLKYHFYGQSRTIFVHWHAAARGWHFREIWRFFLWEHVPDFSLPQRAKKVKKGPLSGSLALVSPLGTKMLAAIRAVVISQPSMRALCPKWTQLAKASFSLYFSNFCTFYFASERYFYHPAPHQCPLGKGGTLGEKFLTDNEKIMYVFCT